MSRATVIFLKPKTLVPNTLYIDHQLNNSLPEIKRIHYFTCKKNTLIERDNDDISYADAKMFCEHDICEINRVLGRVVYWDIKDPNSAYVLVDRLVLNSK